MVRMKSPTPGCSILMTSAPSSASSVAANGAPIRVPRSSTRTPSSAPVTGSEVSVAVLEDLLHRRFLLARGQHVERGLRVVLELVDHEVVLERGAVAGEVLRMVDRPLHVLHGDARHARERLGGASRRVLRGVLRTQP